MTRLISRLRPSQMPLRWRLTMWYTLSMGVLLILFASFLYFQISRSLMAQMDGALQLAASQAVINISNDGNQLFFQVENNPDTTHNLSQEFVIHLIANDGAIWDTFSSESELLNFPVQVAGYHTVMADAEPWRVFVQEFSANNVTGRLQIAQELEPIYRTLASFRRQLLLGIPIALILAGLGGYFLASRALRPIDQMTQTAQSISANDLNRRIQYLGPPDEIGRLAQTFDNMLDRLQSAFERERRFTGDAAHELRTPLTALKGRIGVTLSRPRHPAVYGETLREMEGQVDRLIRLSSDLLFIARLDQDSYQKQHELIDLDGLLGAVVDRIRPLTTAKAITLTETVPANLTIQGDMDLLIRLFLNLLDNAVKYTPENGRIAIEAAQEQSATTVAISDSGQGIAPEHLPHLFERFYRGESDRARSLPDKEPGGAGLGLAIAYEIVRAHGGDLRAVSEPDQGTTFIVTFCHN